MTNNPFFGILLSIVTYEIGVLIAKKTKSPLANPLLIGIILSIVVLKAFKIPFEDFEMGGSYIKFLLGPATVCLVVPLYKKLELLKKNLLAVFMGILVGSITSVLSVFVLSKVFGLDQNLFISLLPKSITTAIGVDVSAEYGGLEAITAICIIGTGIFGAVVGPSFLKLVGVKDPVATGIALGTTSHAVGTSKAMELGEVQGAMSGLCIGIAGLITVLIMPIAIQFI